MARLFAAFLLVGVCCALSSALEVTKVERTINLQSNVARHSITIDVKPEGSSYFYFAIPAANVSAVTRVIGKRGNDKLLHTDTVKTLPDGVLASGSKAPEGAQFTKVKINGKKDTYTLKIEYAEVGIIPFPRTTTSQTGHHFVEYYGNQLLFVPYVVSKQRTTITLPKGTRVESATPKPDENKGDTVVYAKDGKADPFSFKSFRIHFTTQSSFGRATRAHRVFQLSHWGMLSVEEEYTLRNDAVKFEGSFSRLDYERSKPASSLNSAQAVIPAKAQDLYFRDSIGNISTSNVKRNKGEVTVNLQQRYPLMGGWQSIFHWGFNLPMSEAVTSLGGNLYAIDVQYAPYLTNVLAEEFDLEIRLPDGATFVNATLLGEGAKPEVRKSYTNLYITGRPTAVFLDRNVISPDNNHIVQIVYSYSTTTMINQPLFLAAIFLGFFVISFFYSRAQ